MKKRPIVWIVATVVLLHAAVLLAVYDKRPLPKRRIILRPTFSSAMLETFDKVTGEKLTYRQFTVRTRMTRLGEPPTTDDHE